MRCGDEGGLVAERALTNRRSGERDEASLEPSIKTLSGDGAPCCACPGGAWFSSWDLPVQ